MNSFEDLFFVDEFDYYDHVHEPIFDESLIDLDAEIKELEQDVYIDCCIALGLC